MLCDRSRMEESTVETLAEESRQFADPLQTAEDLDVLMDLIGNARFVLRRKHLMGHQNIRATALDLE